MSLIFPTTSPGLESILKRVLPTFAFIWLTYFNAFKQAHSLCHAEDLPRNKYISFTSLAIEVSHNVNAAKDGSTVSRVHELALKWNFDSWRPFPLTQVTTIFGPY